MHSLLDLVHEQTWACFRRPKCHFAVVTKPPMMTKWPQRGLLINQLIGPYSEPSLLSLEVLSPLGNDSCVSGSVPTSDYEMILSWDRSQWACGVICAPTDSCKCGLIFWLGECDILFCKLFSLMFILVSMIYVHSSEIKVFVHPHAYKITR